jgi:hypothetical protein
MTTAGTGLNRKEKRAGTAETLLEMCTVRLGTTVFGVPITHILEIVGAARAQPVPLAPVFVGAPGAKAKGSADLVRPGGAGHRSLHGRSGSS